MWKLVAKQAYVDARERRSSASFATLLWQYWHFDSLEAVLQFDLDIGAQLDIIKAEHAEHAELGVFTKVQICLSQLPENLVSLSR